MNGFASPWRGSNGERWRRPAQLTGPVPPGKEYAQLIRPHVDAVWTQRRAQALRAEPEPESEPAAVSVETTHPTD
jgi:hypothetical protein